MAASRKKTGRIEARFGACRSRVRLNLGGAGGAVLGRPRAGRPIEIVDGLSEVGGIARAADGLDRLRVRLLGRRDGAGLGRREAFENFTDDRDCEYHLKFL